MQLKNPKFKGRGNLYCAICDVMCSDEKNYNVHINGRKHKNKAKMLQLQQQGGRTSEMNTDDNDSKYAEFGFKNINDLKDVTEEQIEKLQKQFGYMLEKTRCEWCGRSIQGDTREKYKYPC